ncbi:MAG: CHAT domain-containing tetratricopeptide repeat protein [Acidobacteriota bacterium]
MQKVFDGIGVAELRAVTIRQTSVDGNKARLRVIADIYALDKAGQPIAGLAKRQRSLQCIREGAEWRVWRESSVAQELAEALATLPADTDRAVRLRTESEWVSLELAQELFNQGTQHFRRENFSQAIALHKLARDVAEQFGDRAIAARCLSHIGMAQHASGDYTSARVSYEESLKLAQVLQLKPGILANLNNLANLYAELGDYGSALKTYGEILGLAESEGNQANVVIVLNNLANAYVSTGNNAKSLEYLQRALALTEGAGSQVSRAISLSTQAWVFLRQGNDELAESHFQKSLALLRNAADDPVIKTAMADTLSSLGRVEKKRGRYDEAISYYRESLALREGRSEVEAAHEMVNIGDVYRLQGRHSEARDYYDRSLALEEKWNDREGVAMTLTSIAHLQAIEGRHQSAVESAERGSGIAAQVGNRELFWRARTLAGISLEALGRTVEAQKTFDEAISSIEDLWAQAAGGARQQQQVFDDKLAPYHGALIALLRQHDDWTALEYAERARARTLLEVLESGQVNVTKSMTAVEQERERLLTDRMISVNTQSRRENLRPSPDEARLRDLEKQQQQARLEYETFETNLYTARPDLRIKRGRIPKFTVKQAAELLPDADTAVFEYVVTDERTFLFVLTQMPESTLEMKSRLARPGAARTRTPALKVYEIAIGRQALSERTENFRRLLAKHDMVFRQEAAALFSLLMKPALSELRSRKRLIVVPDGSLWELPFQALETGSQRSLIEDLEISYAPSLTVLTEMIRLRAKRIYDTHPVTLLAFGNADFGTRSDPRAPHRVRAGRLAPLDETEVEVRSLAKIYGSRASKIFTGSAATEENFKAEAGRARILHLATHGILHDNTPMYSQLVFSQSGRSAREDGLLEAWELMQLDLNADLVVLSACETARGPVGGGEGALGLAWALFVAGSPATVASQWKVDSSSTGALMLAFHQGLRAGEGQVQGRLTTGGALRLAALKLLRNPQYHHPFYWAGFVLIGDGH